MVGGEAGAPAQPEPHAERGRALPAVPAACPRPPARPTAPGGPAGATPLPAAAGELWPGLRTAGLKTLLSIGSSRRTSALGLAPSSRGVTGCPQQCCSTRPSGLPTPAREAPRPSAGPRRPSSPPRGLVARVDGASREPRSIS